MADETQKFTPSQMRGLLAAGRASQTRALRHWEPPTAEVIQRALPQYEVTAFIARGGMGAVYKGMQRALGRVVAIKILPPDIVDDGGASYALRFKQEARAMARLSHPGIVAVFDAGETANGLLYFVMEFVEGTDLAQIIASEGSLEPRRAIAITTAVCEALAFAHEEGIIHRDIKPSNIVIDKKGRVKVADFGLAKVTDILEADAQDESGVAVGTPYFAAPEALRGGVEVDRRADLYAVGVMLYQMLTGELPRGRFSPPSEVSPQVDRGFDAIVERAMQADREKRYSSAEELRDDVERVFQLVPGQRTSWKTRFTVLALAALAVGGGIVWWQVKTTARSATPPTGPQWSRMPTEDEKKLAFTNTLGMKFVPVPGTEVLFCIHETRKGDYAAYAAANPGVDATWSQPAFYRDEPVSATNDHPVVWVSSADAQGFCAWLSAKEGRKYRLPTDHEWSCAVGIGDGEDTKALPTVRGGRFVRVFAWGIQWPPPKGAGNLGDETLKRVTGQEPIIAGYDDGFATTAPVMSFPANALGIHDLAGNAWEWCPDWFDSLQRNAVRRGSSFNNGNPDANRAYVAACVRNPKQPEERSEDSGFRIVAEKQP